MTEQDGEQDTISFREHVVLLLTELDLRFQQRVEGLNQLTDAKFVTFRTLLDSQAEKVALALAASDKATVAALNSADRAIVKAEVATEKRFEGVNEFRRTVEDITRIQMPRAEAEQRITGLAEKLDSQMAGLVLRIEAQFAGTDSRIKAVADEVKSLQLYQSNLTGRITVLVGALGLFLTVVVFVANFAFK